MAFAAFATTYTKEPTSPASGPQPGALALMDWTLEEWDQADLFDDPDPGNLGIYNPRDIFGHQWPDWVGVGSQHARGAALDVRFPTVAGGHPEGWKYARWLVANHEVLGVQEVIYGGKRWTNQTKRWLAYDGPSPHDDHVHVALNASGARYLTRARIESVAPTPPEVHPLAALTDAEQRELLNNSRRSAKAAAAVVKRYGGRKVFLQLGGQLVQIAATSTEPQVAQALFDLGQGGGVEALPTELFDSLHQI